MRTPRASWRHRRSSLGREPSSRWLPSGILQSRILPQWACEKGLRWWWTRSAASRLSNRARDDFPIRRIRSSPRSRACCSRTGESRHWLRPGRFHSSTPFHTRFPRRQIRCSSSCISRASYRRMRTWSPAGRGRLSLRSGGLEVGTPLKRAFEMELSEMVMPSMKKGVSML